MTSAQPLRVAGVGAGYFSQFHYGSWARMDTVRLVGACDLDIGRARATAAPAFSDLAAMLAETSPDLLDIILPPATQATAIRTGIDAGVPTLICQKPFCQSLDEAHEMAALAARTGTRLIVHENFRFQPWYRVVKRALDAGAVGTLHQVSFRLRPGDGQGPRAYLDRQPYFRKMTRFLVHETGVHWIDTFRFLLGDPTAVYADLRQVNPAIAGEDAGYLLFDHPRGVRAMLDGNRHLDHATDNTRRTMGEALFEGTAGTLEVLGDGSVLKRGFGQQDTTIVLPPDTWPGFGGDCVHALQSHVVSAVLNGTPVENAAEDYLNVIRIEAAIYRSAQEGRKISV